MIKSKKRTWTGFVVLILTIICSGSAAAKDTGYAGRIWVRDDAGLMSDDEVTKLNETCGKLSDEYDTGISIITVDDFGGGDITKWQEGKYIEYELGEADGGVMLAVSMADRDWGIKAFGAAEDVFTVYSREKIADLFLDDLSDGDYYEAFDTYAKLCGDFLKKAQTGEVYSSENPYKRPAPVWLIIVISFAVSLIISLIIVMSWKKGMNTKGMQAEAVQYLRKDSFRLTRREDLFLYRTVNRTKKPENNGNSGSGSSRPMKSSGSGTRGKF